MIFSKNINGAAILMYHSIGENDAFGTVSTNAFSKQMEYIRKNKLRVVPLSYIVRSLKMKKDIRGLVAITFDDGYQDFYTSALPVIKENKIIATLFVITGVTNFTTSDSHTFPILNKNQLGQIANSGLVELCSHTSTHPNLISLDKDELRKEIEDSYHTLCSIATPPRILAYPRGKYDQESISVLRSLGWDGAVTVREGYASESSNLFELPRISIDSKTSFRYFKAIVNYRLDVYYRIKTWLS